MGLYDIGSTTIVVSLMAMQVAVKRRSCLNTVAQWGKDGRHGMAWHNYNKGCHTPPRLPCRGSSRQRTYAGGVLGWKRLIVDVCRQCCQLVHHAAMQVIPLSVCGDGWFDLCTLIAQGVQPYPDPESIQPDSEQLRLPQRAIIHTQSTVSKPLVRPAWLHSDYNVSA